MATHSSILAWRIPGTEVLVGCRLWHRTESDTTDATSQQQQQQQTESSCCFGADVPWGGQGLAAHAERVLWSDPKALNQGLSTLVLLTFGAGPFSMVEGVPGI